MSNILFERDSALYNLFADRLPFEMIETIVSKMYPGKESVSKIKTDYELLCVMPELKRIDPELHAIICATLNRDAPSLPAGMPSSGHDAAFLWLMSHTKKELEEMYNDCKFLYSLNSADIYVEHTKHAYTTHLMRIFVADPKTGLMWKVIDQLDSETLRAETLREFQSIAGEFVMELCGIRPRPASVDEWIDIIVERDTERLDEIRAEYPFV